MEFDAIRTEYRSTPLREVDVAADPITQFERWFADALAANVLEPDAMTVATVGADGGVSARTVSLRGFDARGFAFYTNYRSRKGQELEADARAAVVFHWRELARQVRATGRVERLGAEESERYYRSRPLDSRIAAWASPQSDVIASRDALEAEVAAVRERLGADPPRPPFWGGFVVVPDEVEFWQGREARLHDRLRYTRAGPTSWHLDRLAP